MAGYNPWETPFNERGFRAWSGRFGLDPDDPEYDWRRAYAAGAKPDAAGNWPSQYRRKPAAPEEPSTVTKDTLVGALEDLKKLPADFGGSLMAGLAQTPGTLVRSAEGLATGAGMIPKPSELAESLRRQAARGAGVPTEMPEMSRDPRQQLLGPSRDQLLSEAGSALSANLRAPGEKAAEFWAPEEADWRSRPVNAAVQAVGTAIPSLAVATTGAALGGPGGALAASAPLIFGGSYGEAVDRGVDPETAFKKAIAETAISSPLEAAGGALAHQALRGGGGLVQALRALAQGGEEVAQEEVAMGLERATGATITPEQAAARRFQGFAGGTGGGGLAAGIGSLTSRGDTAQLPDATIPRPSQLPDALVPGGVTEESLLSVLGPTLRDQDLPPWARAEDLADGIDAAVERVQARQEGAARFGQPTPYYEGLRGEEGRQNARAALVEAVRRRADAVGYDPAAPERMPTGESLDPLTPRNPVEYMERFGERGGRPEPRGATSLEDAMARLDREVMGRRSVAGADFESDVRELVDQGKSRREALESLYEDRDGRIGTDAREMEGSLGNLTDPGEPPGERLDRAALLKVKDSDLPKWAKAAEIRKAEDLQTYATIKAEEALLAKAEATGSGYSPVGVESLGRSMHTDLRAALTRALGRDPFVFDEGSEPTGTYSARAVEAIDQEGNATLVGGGVSLDEARREVLAGVFPYDNQLEAAVREQYSDRTMSRRKPKTLADYLNRAKPAEAKPEGGPLLPGWLQGEEGAAGGRPAGPTRVPLDPGRAARMDKIDDLYFGKLPEPEKKSAKEWLVDKADRAYEKLFHDLAAPEKAVKRALLGGVKPFQHAGEVQSRIADLTRLTQAGHGFKTSPIFHSTRVVSDFSQPVREFYSLIGEDLPEAAPGEFINTGEPAAAIFEGWDDQLESDMMRFAAYRRHLELANRKLAGDDLKIDSRATEHARERAEAIQDQYPDLDLNELADRVTAWERKATLEPLIEVGVLSPQEGALAVQKNLKHVPYFRMEKVLGKERLQQLQDEGVIPHSKAKTPRVYRIHGGLSSEEGMQLDPRMFENMVQRAVSLQEFAAKQRLRNELADLAESGLDLGIEKAPEGVTKGTFKRWKNGESELWDGPPSTVKALEGLTEKERGLFWRLFLSPSVAVLRAGVTAGPKFILKQLLGDPVNSYLLDPNARFKNLAPVSWMLEGRKPKLSDLKDNPFRPYTDAAGGLYEILTNGEDYREAIAGGVGDALLVSLDHVKPDNLLKLARTAHKTKDSGYVESFLTQYTQAIKKSKLGLPVLLFPLQQLSGMQDMSSRIAAYKRAKGADKSTFEALSNAAEAPLNFSRGGSVVKQMNGWQAFTNPSFLDPDRFARALVKDGANTVAKGIATITLPHVAEWLAWHDDDDYREQPEWKRATFYYIGKRDNGGFYLWPKPLGIPLILFGTATTKLLDAAFGKRPQAARELLELTHEGTPLRLLPIQGPLEGRLPNLTDLTDTVTEWSPTVATPSLEAAFNRKMQFNRGAPIVPQRLESGVDAEEIQPWTPHAYRWLGEQTGSSPEKLRHVGEGHTGYVGKIVNRGLDWALEATGKVEPKERLRPSDLADSMIYGGFFSRQAGQSATSLDEFRDALDAYNEQLTSARRKYNLKKSRGVYESPMELFFAKQEYPLLAKMEVYSAGEKELYELGSARRDAIEKQDWDEVDKLDKQMANLARLRLRMLSGR